VSTTVANAVGSRTVVSSRTGGAVTTTSPSDWSAARARATAAASARRSSGAGRCDVSRASRRRDEGDERRTTAATAGRRPAQLLPRGRRSLLASTGQVFWLGDRPRPVPSHPYGQWLRPGSSPLTAAGQRGLCTPFPNPIDVAVALARAIARCQGRFVDVGRSICQPASCRRRIKSAKRSSDERRRSTARSAAARIVRRVRARRRGGVFPVGTRRV
jgi:hypothetical protein